MGLREALLWDRGRPYCGTEGGLTVGLREALLWD